MADFLHGPIAAVDPGAAVLAHARRGPGGGRRRRGGRGAAAARRRCRTSCRRSTGVPEALAPIAASVRGQQLALELALRKGLDPDAPRGLNKVTITR